MTAFALHLHAARRARRAYVLALPMALGFALTMFETGAQAANDAYRPPAEQSYGGSYSGGSGGDAYQPAPAPAAETYEPYGSGASGRSPTRPLDGTRRPDADPSGYGEPYRDAPPPAEASREERYEAVPPADQGGPPETASRGTYTQDEIIRAGHGFFGKVSGGMASAIEWAFQKAGRPNGYILGQDAGGAVIAGLRYGEGTLHTKDAGTHRVYWQGPSLGYDMGAEGSKVMTLVYNLRDPSEIYNRFGGVQGAAYLVGGVSVQLQKNGDVTLAPIRAGVGLRLGANVGYLKYSRKPTWNPF